MRTACRAEYFLFSFLSELRFYDDQNSDCEKGFDEFVSFEFNMFNDELTGQLSLS